MPPIRQQPADLGQFLRESQKGVEEGLIPARLFSDPELYHLEVERLFAKTWVFLAHESEIPSPGDYVVRYITDDSFIVCRDEKGKIQVFLNVCRHRGMELCRSERGNTSHFRCPYHGWTYTNSGDLIGVPARQQAYGDRLNTADWSLCPPPRFDQYNGLIFATVDPEAPSLDEYLGDVKWYLDLLFKRSEAGVTVSGPLRWTIDVNWKIPSENIAGDSYHTVMGHKSAVEMGLVPKNPLHAMQGIEIECDGGHAMHFQGGGDSAHRPPFFAGLPKEIVESLHKSYPSQAHIDVARQTGIIHGLVFPNLGFTQVAMAGDLDSKPTPFLSLRIWRPLGPDKMEVWLWFVVEKDAPEAFKQASYESFVRNHSVTGVFQSDDTEIWESITRATKGILAPKLQFHYAMDLGHREPAEGWPGPGRAFNGAFVEGAQRLFYREYFTYLTKEA